ncbi:MAG: Holliday junction branch migration DNA helicase RuvB [Phycisphaerales bacterium]|nr:Holliday junction branch migration DNA helicase RuvB [Phycisphaerales bacterium]
MAKDRIVSANQQSEDAPVETTDTPRSLRPTHLDGFTGQSALRQRLCIALDAARQRNEPMEHLLLHGPPGLGKTTLAHVVANEMDSRVFVTSGPALTRGSDLVGTLTRMQPGDILFIDEIHRLPVSVEEYIYPAMEDFKIDFTLDSGMHAKIVTYQLKPFTLIGATTRAGLLTSALRSRFGISHRLDYYEVDELEAILERAMEQMKLTAVTPDARVRIAERSRGTPRICLRLLRRVRDFAQVRNAGRIDADVVTGALELEGVDELGLDALDRAYLRTVSRVYNGGPVGLEAIAATMGEDSGTLEDLVEPYLLQIGHLARTRQGRQLTSAARTWLSTQGTSDHDLH